MSSVTTLAADLQANLRSVHERITKAARGAGRDPSSVRLIAVSKAFNTGTVLNAVTAGQRAFGENYVQEAATKMTGIARLRPDLALEWHFIGPIQSNKTRALAEHFDWVQSVDRVNIAERLSTQRPATLPSLNVLLQVNVSGEASKGGVAANEAVSIARTISRLPQLRLRGLMAIPELHDEFDKQRVPFRAMKRLFDELVTDGVALDTLSMGMSADLEAAIVEGSTMVRIGTAIFGERSSSQ